MELFHLKLNRCVVANYRSVKHIALDHLGNLVCLAGRNNAGKSNLLDAFQFISDAAISFEHALASRGGDLAQVIHRKKPHVKMEFVFEFALAQEKRNELIQQLFAKNTAASVSDIMASDFLSALTLKVVMARDHFNGELSTKNLRGGPSCLIFSIQGAPKKTEITYGQLEALCQTCKEEIPSQPIVPDLPAEPGQPWRLRLGPPESAWVFPVCYELAEGVRQQFASLGWASSLGVMTSADSRQPALMAEEANLPEALHWVYNNKPSQFRRIEAQVQKLVPRLGKLHTPTVQKATTLALIDSRDEDLIFSNSQMSAGTRAAVALVTKVMLAAPGAWVCIEEPEHCVHPQAQAQLAQFLLAESVNKRIFCATHAPAIAAACPISSLFILKRDADNCTTALPVTSHNAIPLTEELGVAASFSFEADAVVFVEHADYVPVYEAWAKKHGFRPRVQFLACGGGDTLEYFANARVALSRFVHTTVLAVFGNGSTEARKRIAQHLQLADDQIVTMDFPELEGCLLDPTAIRKAFPAITLSEAELETRLNPALVLLDQKKTLCELLAEFKIGDYDGQMGGRIAECMETIPPDVAQLFKKIESRAKPYWEI